MDGEAGHAVANEAIKVAPAAAVAGTTMLGLDWQTGVYVVTICYVLLQSAYLIWKWVREWHAKARANPAE